MQVAADCLVYQSVVAVRELSAGTSATTPPVTFHWAIRTA